MLQRHPSRYFYRISEGALEMLYRARFWWAKCFNFFWIIIFAVLGAGILACLGLLAGIWAEKFDHMGAVTNFIITPMTFLSGTFYSIKDLPSQVYGIAQYNPFFQAIDGFRYGITGYADGNLLNSGLSLLILNILLYALSCYLFRIGYKLKS